MGHLKAKISITVSREVLAAIDRGITSRRYRSRSSAIQSALDAWARAQRNTEIDTYYDSITISERNESAEWAALGHEALAGERAPSPRRVGRRRR